MYYYNNDNCIYNPVTGMIVREGKYDMALLQMEAEGTISLTDDFGRAAISEQGEQLAGSYRKTIYTLATEEQIDKYSTWPDYRKWH